MFKSKLASGVMIALCAAFGNAATIHVNGTTGNDAWDGLCETWNGDACGPVRTINRGVQLASLGDVVLLADGTYTGDINRDVAFAGKAITLRSASGREFCIVDCESSGRGFRFVDGEGLGSKLLGVTIRNGRAPSGTPFGGGIYVQQGANPTIEDCIIENCYATEAGGIYVGAGQAFCRIEDCLIRNNTAVSCGGIRGTGAELRHCVIAGNSAQSHGGGYVFGVMENCTVADNHDESEVGGISIQGVARQLVVSGNSSITGVGGVHGSLTAVYDTLVVGNYTFGVFAAGLHMPPGCRADGCVITANASFNQLGASGVSFYMPSPGLEPPRLTNSVVYGNFDTNLSIDGFVPLDSVRYCDIEHGFPGTTNIGVDPQFVDPIGLDLNPMDWEDNDYHLLPTSPCIHRGDPATTSFGRLDTDGEPRVMGGRVDIGIDEFTDDPFAFGDTNCDGIRDFFDIDPFVAALGGDASYYTQYPDCFRQSADCNDNGEIDFFDIDAFVGLLGD